ncbi:MAG TPA: hypothetical protein PKJ37_10705 [Acidobacteriota bacterium]|nr:hypothetical protein [Acidobacteriota bacterium]HNT18345.1 hypothetical protein [Acidobacteriota bacterium]
MPLALLSPSSLLSVSDGDMIFLAKYVDLAPFHPSFMISLAISFLVSMAINTLIILLVFRKHKVLGIILFIVSFLFTTVLSPLILNISYNLLVEKVTSVGVIPAGGLFMLCPPIAGLILSIYLAKLKQKNGSALKHY